MNYRLETKKKERGANSKAIKELLKIIVPEKVTIGFALVFILVNSGLNLLAPFLIAYTIDNHILKYDIHGTLVFAVYILIAYIIAAIAQYLQIKLMGTVGLRVLFRLRNDIFNKIQSLPIFFFNQNKAGDLISRINNDTDKLSQFFSQSVLRLVGTIFIVIGAAIFIVVIKPQLGILALSPAFVIIILTKFLSSWVRKKNKESLDIVGSLSAEVQESLENFKVVVAFDRRDYFRKKFDEINKKNYIAAFWAGMSNIIFSPIYDFAQNMAQLIVLSYGIHLILQGQFTIGLLIGFLTYIDKLYTPIRQLATIWANFQLALASWDRITEILSLHSNIKIVHSKEKSDPRYIMQFKNVSFAYSDGKDVLKNVNIELEKGKTYAFVGPTGGGKTTTASLMARLFDATNGTVFLLGDDIRTYDQQERTERIGFILQDPFLVTGTLRDNILYGNMKYHDGDEKALEETLKKTGLDALVEQFSDGLDTVLSSNADGISLGQKQLIAFSRAVLREPELLILDEATANIDTVTEKLLEKVLNKLPIQTTKVIIAHRLNTIQNAHRIFFVNSGTITPAGSMEDAVEMLLHVKRKS